MDKSKIKVFLLTEIVLYSLVLLFMKVILVMEHSNAESKLAVVFLTFRCILPLYSVITGCIIVFLLKTKKSYLLGIIVTTVFSLITTIVMCFVYGVFDNTIFTYYPDVLFSYLGILVITYAIALLLKKLWKTCNKK